MTYAQKLKDPRWQKKRLEIFERDKWKCKECGSSTKNLQVHHLYYRKIEPWEYPNYAYQTLCEECHNYRQEVAGNLIDELRVRLATVPNKDLYPVICKSIAAANDCSRVKIPTGSEAQSLDECLAHIKRGLK